MNANITFINNFINMLDELNKARQSLNEVIKSMPITSSETVQVITILRPDLTGQVKEMLIPVSGKDVEPETTDTEQKECAEVVESVESEIVENNDWYVDENGDVYENGIKLVPFLKHGYAWLYVNGKRMKQQSLVVSKFLSPSNVTGDKIIHLDDNPLNNHPSNLCWRSKLTETKHRTMFDASIAADICEALVETNFDPDKTQYKLIMERKIITTLTRICQIRDKELFTRISDKYFDEKLHIIRRPMPKPIEETDAPKPEKKVERKVNRKTYKPICTTKPELESHVVDKIKTCLSMMNNDIIKTITCFNDDENVTMYDIFNIKWGKSSKNVNNEDVPILIQYARKHDEKDIEHKLLTECDISVTKSQITSATRQKINW